MSAPALGPGGMGDLFLELEPLVVPETHVKLSIQDRFQAFHDANPWVYRELVKLARDAVATGQSRTAIDMLVNVLRWQYGRTTTGDPFKLNNDYRSRYARKIAEDHPELAHLFVTRELRTP